MQKAIKMVYKAEIQENLLSANDQIEQLLSDVKANVDWQMFYKHTQKAVSHLNDAIRLLAEQHVTICVLSKYRHPDVNFLPEDIDEITKTYRYLN